MSPPRPGRARARALVVCALAAATGACAGVERTVYETLQNVQDQQCARDYAGKCPDRQSYDGYRRETSR